MLDITIAAAKSREKAVSSLDPSFGDAGVFGTRKAPVLLSDKSSRLIDEFCSLVRVRQRSDYRTNVMSRLSGAAGYGAVHAACVKAAEDYIAVPLLQRHGLVPWTQTEASR